MKQLSKYYLGIKQLYKSRLDKGLIKSLPTCSTLLDSYAGKSAISEHLYKLGYAHTAQQEAVLFFALTDIIVVVEPDESYYFATLSEMKLNELSTQGYIDTRGIDKSVSDSLNRNTTNTYLKEGKFHFVSLYLLSDLRPKYSASKIKRYPDLKDCRVYPLSILCDFYNCCAEKLASSTCAVNLHNPNTSIKSSTLPSSDRCIGINSSPCSCSLWINTFDSGICSILVWNICSIQQYTESEPLSNLKTGICKINDTYVTLNRGVLERYYGSQYLEYESVFIREKYCLASLLTTPDNAEVFYFIHKYKLYADRELRNCRSVVELRNILIARTKLSGVEVKNSITARVLASTQQLFSGEKPYYKAINNPNELVSVSNIISTMPQVYKVSGISHNGYEYVEVVATSFASAESYGRKEFIRQFGYLHNNAVLGIERGNEIYKSGHRVIYVNPEVQLRTCEAISWGYKDYYSCYSKYIKSIIATLNLKYTVDDAMIQVLFINNIAKKCGKCRGVTIELFAQELEIFLNLLLANSESGINIILGRA